MRYFLSLIAVILFCPLALHADATYEQMQVKAQRLFDQDDWIPAGALYAFMIHERPTVTDNYGRAIIAAYSAADTVMPMKYLSDALSAHVPLDSVLSKVSAYAFSKSRASMYEQFMLQASHQYPWLERPIQPYLLRYYTMRRNGPEMIHYSLILLRGLPSDPGFLSTLAEGYMIDNQYQKAVDTWMDIINAHPDNYQALINLATFYNQSGSPDRALPYFQRAQALRSTPYVARQIETITAKTKK